MTPSKILFVFCIAFLAGIFAGSIVKIPHVFLWCFLFFGILLITASLFLKRDNFAVAGFCLFFLAIGIIRLDIAQFNIKNNELKNNNDKGEIVLVGKVMGEPDIRENSQKIKIESESPKGIVLVTTSRYQEYKYLDKLKITGQLKTPFEAEDGAPSGSYKNYLLKDGIYSVMDFPKIEPMGYYDGKLANKAFLKVLWFKQELRESIRKNYSPPQSLILEGTILGNSGVIPQDLKNKLNITGLRHIVAVSGTHVIILGAILTSFLLALGLRRQHAFYVSVVFIWLYIILTGLASSGIRAGIMGSLFLLAQNIGRQNTATYTITMAAAIMVAFNPLILLYDIGFQLSFLASMGIIFLNPFFKNLFKFDPISTTFSAQIFTLPLMVYNFGNISLVSPITNLLVLPIVPYLMVLGFLSSILGTISQLLGWIVSLPCWFLLTYFIKIVELFSQDFAVKTIENVSLVWVIFSYLILGSIVRWLQKNKRAKFLEY